jgi:hypothetical protein
MDKTCSKFWTHFRIKKKLPNENNRPIGQNSPCLVTLIRKIGFLSKETKVFLIGIDDCLKIKYKE